MCPPPPPPPTPTRGQCEASSGTIAASNLNWFEKLAGFKTEDIGGSEKVWVYGTVDELHMGTKWEIITGKVSNAHEQFKTQEIIGNETKINIGTLNQAFFAMRIKYDRSWTKEFHIGYKVEIWPKSGQLWDGYKTKKSAQDQRKLDDAKEVISQFEKKVLAKAQRDTKEAYQAIKSLKRQIDRLKYSGDKLQAQCQEIKFDGKSSRIETNGTFDHKTGSLVVAGGRLADYDGDSKLTLQSGGDKVEVTNGKATVNGTDIVVEK